MLRVNPYKETSITPFSSSEFEPSSKKIRLEGALTENSFKKLEINFWDAAPVALAGNNIGPISNTPWPGERSISSFQDTSLSSTEIEDEEDWIDAYNILKMNSDPAPLLAFIRKEGNLLHDDDLWAIVELANKKYPEIIFALFQHYPEPLGESDGTVKDAFIPENLELIESLLKNDPNMDWKRYCYIKIFENPKQWNWVKEPLLGLILEYGETLSSQVKKSLEVYRNSCLAEEVNNWRDAYKTLKKNSDPAPLLAHIQNGLLKTLNDTDATKILYMIDGKFPEFAFECFKHLSAHYVDNLDYDIWSPVFIPENLDLIESLLVNDHHMAWKKRLHLDISFNPEEWKWMPERLLKMINECEEKIILEDNTYQKLKLFLGNDLFINALKDPSDHVKFLLENEPKIKMFDQNDWDSYFSGPQWQDLDPRITHYIDSYLQKKIAFKQNWEKDFRQKIENESIDLCYTYEDNLSDQKRIDRLNQAMLENNGHHVEIALNMPECHNVLRWKKTVFNHYLSNPSPHIWRLLARHLQKHLRYFEDALNLET